MSVLAGVLTGLFAGALGSLLGVGGGLVMVPIMVAVFALETRVAVATSLATIIPIALISTWRYAGRDLVDWRVFGYLTAGAVVGAFVGTWIAPQVPALWLRRLFATWMVIAAVQMFLKK